jgi:hypothetical protein
MSKPRIYADFNDWDADGCCRCIRYNHRRLEEVAGDLGFYDGMPVVVFYEDPGEEFEFDGVLELRPDGTEGGQRWVAVVDRNTYRLIRETSLEELRKQGFIP